MAKQALDGTRQNIFLIDPNDVTIIGLDTEDGPDHYLWDPRIKLPLDEALVKNIAVYGVLDPVKVVKDGDRILVVDGRQRVRACREAAERAKKAGEIDPRLPVSVRKGEEKYLFGISRSANALRRADGAMTNASNAQRMLDMGSSEAEVALTFGVKPQTIKDWVSLLGLSAKVRKAVDAGEVSPSAAAGLAKLSKADQEEHLAELQAEGVKPTRERVKKKARKKAGKSQVMTPKDRIGSAMNVLREVFDRYVDGNPITAQDLDAVAKTLSGVTLTAVIAGELAKQKAAVAEAETAQTSN